MPNKQNQFIWEPVNLESVLCFWHKPHFNRNVLGRIQAFTEVGGNYFTSAALLTSHGLWMSRQWESTWLFFMTLNLEWVFKLQNSVFVVSLFKNKQKPVLTPGWTEVGEKGIFLTHNCHFKQWALWYVNSNCMKRWALQQSLTRSKVLQVLEITGQQ